AATDGPPLITGSEGGHLSRLFNSVSGERIDARGYQSLLANMESHNGDLAVYVHLPFCASRCLSCDHVTNVTHDAREIDHYLDDLELELERVTGHFDSRKRLSQLHLGGGTPNYLSDRQLLRLMNMLESRFILDADTDALIEASAKRTSWSQLQMLKGMGFNSIKLQVRDLDPMVQKAVGRSDSHAVMADVFANARDVGIKTVGMDLVYGLPQQSQDSINRSIDEILGLGPERLSCYAYTRKTGEFMHQRAIDAPSMPSLADQLIMFNNVVNRMEAAGYVWIGLDTFVKRDDPLATAQREGRLYHNWMGYNALGNSGVLGFGASAISEIGGACVQNFSAVEDYAAALDAGRLPVRGGVRLDVAGQRRREVLNALLCNLEVDDVEQVLPKEAAEQLHTLQEQGVLRIEGARAYVTPQGRYLLHQVCGHNEPDKRWASGW
ncbi:MAG: radical SAM protein, partial [Halieaceae bacterium]|nr:radical SAM protein [Halieaceae bacterium]